MTSVANSADSFQPLECVESLERQALECSRDVEAREVEAGIAPTPMPSEIDLAPPLRTSALQDSEDELLYRLKMARRRIDNAVERMKRVLDCTVAVMFKQAISTSAQHAANAVGRPEPIECGGPKHASSTANRVESLEQQMMECVRQLEALELERGVTPTPLPTQSDLVPVPMRTSALGDTEEELIYRVAMLERRMRHVVDRTRALCHARESAPRKTTGSPLDVKETSGTAQPSSASATMQVGSVKQPIILGERCAELSDAIKRMNDLSARARQGLLTIHRPMVATANATDQPVNDNVVKAPMHTEPAVDTQLEMERQTVATLIQEDVASDVDVGGREPNSHIESCGSRICAGCLYVTIALLILICVGPFVLAVILAQGHAY